MNDRNTSVKQSLWVEKYRPRKIADCILPEKIKTTFQEIVLQANVPNLILSGKPGGGKTTAAIAMCEEIGMDWTLINASMKGNIDTLRTEIQDFASVRSFDGKRRALILDEADHLNPNSTQPALRSFIEEYSSNCAFFFTANTLAKIIPALHSRASIIEYAYAKDETSSLMGQFYRRLKFILDSEGIKYDSGTVKKTLGLLILKYWPDFRRTINELQRYTLTGLVDEGILQQVSDAPLDDLVNFLRKDDFKGMREWCAKDGGVDVVRVLRELYDRLYDLFDPSSIPTAVLLIGDAQYKAAFCADQEIHLCAAITGLMLECKFK